MRYRKSSRLFISIILCVSLASPNNARADFWGGDVVVLTQILAKTVEELIQLKEILGVGQDTIGFLRDINEGIREAMGIMRTLNSTIRPGVLGDIQNPDQFLRVVENLYGEIPQTSEAKMQQLNDQSVAEGMTLHNQAFEYANQIDPEAERIKDYARGVSPAGAGRLTAQSLGVLIHVTNQVLRTNAAMVKIMSEMLALQNRKEKLNSAQFRLQYEGISSGLNSSKSFKELSNLKN